MEELCPSEKQIFIGNVAEGSKKKVAKKFLWSRFFVLMIKMDRRPTQPSDILLPEELKTQSGGSEILRLVLLESGELVSSKVSY